MLVNLTNHPSHLWSPEQREAASTFGKIVDIPFPNVPPSMDEAGVMQMALSIVSSIEAQQPTAVLCQGEMTLTYRIVSLLKERGIQALAACSERCVTETVDEHGVTTKVAEFHFCRFRAY